MPLYLCKFCGDPIHWLPHNGKPRAYNPDDTLHKCLGRQRHTRRYHAHRRQLDDDFKRHLGKPDPPPP